MNYIAYYFSCEPRQPLAEILVSDLAEIGFESFVETEKGVDAFIPEPDDSPSSIEALLNKYRSEGEIEFRREKIADQNWNATWEESYEPVRVDKSFLVRAPFHEADSDVETDILIKPQMSFGTGHHETTFLMLNLLDNLSLDGGNVLDMGSGTGVLAIAAKKRGAAFVKAIDIEEWAYRNTLENAALNHTEIEVSLGDASLLEENSYDVILANINKNILIQDMPRYYQSLKTSGLLLLSGFFSTDLDTIRKRTEEFSLKEVCYLEKNAWTAIQFKKNN